MENLELYLLIMESFQNREKKLSKKALRKLALKNK